VAVTGYARLLAHLPVFRGLTDSEAGDIAQLMRLEQRPEGAELCEEDAPGDSIFVLERGSVVATKRTAQGDEQALATIAGPSVIGELALIDGAPRSATVRAATTVTFYRIAVADFDALRAKNHAGAYKVLKNLALVSCERLRDTNERIAAFFADPKASLAAMQERQRVLAHKQKRGGPP
jgi:CRP-like cAMP-binding protein